MTRKEFSEKFDAYMLECRRQGIWIAGGFITFIAFFGYISEYIRDHFIPSWSDGAIGVLMLAILVGSLIPLFFWGRAQVRKRGLACQTCGWLLNDKVARRKVLLTGHCPKCRSKVFDEEPFSKPAAGHSLDREEFKLKLENFNRQTKRLNVELLVFNFAVIFGCVPLAKYLRNLEDSGGLDWVTLPEIKAFACIMSALFIGLAFGAAVLLIKEKHKPRILPCPECNRSLTGGAGRVALERGFCVYCGCRIFEGASPEKVS